MTVMKSYFVSILCFDEKGIKQAAKFLRLKNLLIINTKKLVLMINLLMLNIILRTQIN